jgi:hypothetical protein
MSIVAAELALIDENAALRARVAQLETALKEARRFMEYFAEGRTSFVGSGTPQTCLAQIDAALKDAPQ